MTGEITNASRLCCSRSYSVTCRSRLPLVMEHRRTVGVSTNYCSKGFTPNKQDKQSAITIPIEQALERLNGIPSFQKQFIVSHEGMTRPVTEEKEVGLLLRCLYVLYTTVLTIPMVLYLLSLQNF